MDQQTKEWGKAWNNEEEEEEEVATSINELEECVSEGTRAVGME